MKEKNENLWKSRTDLALEMTENLKEIQVEEGISIEVNYNSGKTIKETIIRITNENGERILGKPQGEYITIEGEDMSDPDETYHKELSRFLASRLKVILGKFDHILVAGLGNHQVTSDSLGPFVVNNLCVTRHLKMEGLIKGGKTLSAIVPGVMAQTGMETSEVIKGVADRIHPDVIVAIDALAARNSDRLNKTIQISNTGIVPGSGVGNHRKEITENTMGVKVIAIGVPTVISVPTIVNDALALLTDESEDLNLKKYMAPSLADMFVTPKNVDEAVKKISYTISEALNRLAASGEM